MSACVRERVRDRQTNTEIHANISHTRARKQIERHIKRDRQVDTLKEAERDADGVQLLPQRLVAASVCCWYLQQDRRESSGKRTTARK